MKLYYLGPVPTMVSNAEYELILRIRDKGYLMLEQLEPHETYLADRLHINKILNKLYKENIIYYYLNENEYDREKLNG